MLPHLVLPSPKLTDSRCEVWSMILCQIAAECRNGVAIFGGIRVSRGDVAGCGTAAIQPFPLA